MNPLIQVINSLNDVHKTLLTSGIPAIRGSNIGQSVSSAIPCGKGNTTTALQIKLLFPSCGVGMNNRL